MARFSPLKSIQSRERSPTTLAAPRSKAYQCAGIWRQPVAWTQEKTRIRRCPRFWTPKVTIWLNRTICGRPERIMLAATMDHWRESKNVSRPTTTPLREITTAKAMSQHWNETHVMARRTFQSRSRLSLNWFNKRVSKAWPLDLRQASIAHKASINLAPQAVTLFRRHKSSG